MANPINSKSTLRDVWQTALPVGPSKNDMLSWSRLSAMPLNDNFFYNVQIGLFGFDFTSFKASCAIALEADCTPWSLLSGWAIGVGINLSTAT